jgi:putative ABC transport system ATP-binding protein
VLQFEGVGKSYPGPHADVTALQDVTFEIGSGQFVVVLGPSGSGKSTLLCLAAGLEQPTMGRVFFDGVDLSCLSEDELAQLRRKEIGFMFQLFHLVEGLTALENVALPLRFSRVPRHEARLRAKELLDELNLGKRARHFPSQLSGGEMQRVGLARALVASPTVLLADEPTGHLDRANGDYLLDRLREISTDRGGTVVLVTHDSHAASYGDRVLNVVDGSLS